MTDYQFRLAHTGDHVEIVNLMNSAYRGESSRAGWTTEADFFAGERIHVEALRRQLNERTTRLMLVMLAPGESKPAGCVFLEFGGDDDRRGCYLGMLTVRPQSQSRGLGRELLAAAENYAWENGAARVTLGVLNPRDALMAWYERRGYRRTGETKPFPYENAAREKPLRDDLHFIFFMKQLAAPVPRQLP